MEESTILGYSGSLEVLCVMYAKGPISWQEAVEQAEVSLRAGGAPEPILEMAKVGGQYDKSLVQDYFSGIFRGLTDEGLISGDISGQVELTEKGQKAVRILKEMAEANP